MRVWVCVFLCRSPSRHERAHAPPIARRFRGETVLPADVFDRFRTCPSSPPPPNHRRKSYWGFRRRMCEYVLLWLHCRPPTNYDCVYFWLILMVFGFEFYLADKSSHEHPFHTTTHRTHITKNDDTPFSLHYMYTNVRIGISHVYCIYIIIHECMYNRH